jgi:septum site-determining protein MinC
MSAVASRPDLPPFEIRNATLTLVALVLGTADPDLLGQALDERFGATPALFDQDPVVIDLSRLQDVAEPIDFEAVVARLRAHRMLPVGVEGGSPAQREAAHAAGLGEAQTYVAREPQGGRAGRAARRAPEAPTPAAKVAEAAAAQFAAAAPAATPTAARGAPTRVITRPLRSGQQVYARGGDLVVLAAVNFGAEVIADGHIHVYAPLRGRAIAGAQGDRAARIFSTCMEPQLVAIAGTYRTTETALPEGVLGKPAQFRLDGETLVVEALAS